MPTLPKDLIDLQLAPVVLAIDRRLDELELLDLRELRMRVALDAAQPDGSRALRKAALLETVTHLIDLRGWSLGWNDRGIRLVHQWHHVTLGVPATFRAYLEGSPEADPAR